MNGMNKVSFCTSTLPASTSFFRALHMNSISQTELSLDERWRADGYGELVDSFNHRWQTDITIDAIRMIRLAITSQSN
jgi:hypothetical protein